MSFNNKKIVILWIVIFSLIIVSCGYLYVNNNDNNNGVNNNYQTNIDEDNDNQSDIVDNILEDDVTLENDADVNSSLDNNVLGEEKEEYNNDEIESNQEDIDDDSENTDDNFSKKKITLIDKSTGGNCAQALEYFYQDSEYRYYFTCIKSNYMYVIINKMEYKLVYALENNIVTIKELEDNGYKFLKESKNLQIR